MRGTSSVGFEIPSSSTTDAVRVEQSSPVAAKGGENRRVLRAQNLLREQEATAAKLAASFE